MILEPTLIIPFLLFATKQRLPPFPDIRINSISFGLLNKSRQSVCLSKLLRFDIFNIEIITDKTECPLLQLICSADIQSFCL